MTSDAPLPAVFQSDSGLLHDARGLMYVVGLYCDLLAEPGVLHPKHRKYVEDLRLVGTRSGALLERLMEPQARNAEGRVTC